MFADAALQDLWEQAEGMDHTLRISPRHFDALKRKLVLPIAFSRSRMFLRMAQRKVGIFRNVPVLVHRDHTTDTHRTLIHALSTKFPARETSRVQVGPSHTMTRLPVCEIMRRWLGGRAIVGVTDLHVRGTRVEEVINTNALSDFNTLVRGSDNLASQEMMTLVIASPGNVTDSHSDDPDGTNHCFFGRKLWLAWDVFEGTSAGLEDVERQNVYGQAKFDISRFLALQSSRWFLISTGDTLFLPGNLTHKVLTLEPYLGVGSFHVGLPSSLDSFTRWIHHGPLWSKCDPKKENATLVDEVIDVTLRVAQRAQAGSQHIRQRWGYDYLHDAYLTWKRSVHSDVQQAVLAHSGFGKLIDIARSMDSRKPQRLSAVA